VPSYEALLANGFTEVLTDGEGEQGKEGALASIRNGVMQSYFLAAFKAARLGPDTAMIRYESTIRFPRTKTLRFLRVYVTEMWVERDGKWNMLNHQETQVR
jgi:hypothetical protein